MEELAAAKIQHAYRIHRRSLLRLEATVIKIQNRVRRKLAIKKKERAKETENEAARKIQEAYKRYLTRASTKQMQT